MASIWRVARAHRVYHGAINTRFIVVHIVPRDALHLLNVSHVYLRLEFEPSLRLCVCLGHFDHAFPGRIAVHLPSELRLFPKLVGSTRQLCLSLASLAVRV